MSSTTLARHAPGLDVTTDLSTLSDALRTVGCAVAAQPHLPILGGVRIDARSGGVTVTATDDEATVAVRLPGTVHRAGTLVAEHRELADVLAALVKGIGKRNAAALPITLHTGQGSTAVVELDGYTVPVTGYPPPEYPPVPDPPRRRARVHCPDLAAGLRRVRIAAAQDDTIAFLCGVHVQLDAGVLTLACSDRFRLAVAEIDALSRVGSRPSTTTAVLPQRPLARLVERFDSDQVEIGVDDPAAPTVVLLRCGSVTVTLRTAENRFPDYRRLLPETASGSFQVERAALLEAARRAQGVLQAKRDSGSAGLRVCAGCVSVVPVPDSAEEPITVPDIAAAVDGVDDPVQWLFRPEYLIDAIRSVSGECVTAHLPHAATRPVLFTETPRGLSDTSEFRHLLMPIRPPA